MKTGAQAIERLEAALGEAAGAEVVLERPGDAEHGDYATNIAMRLARDRKQPPREIAEQLVEQASELADVERAEIAGPGFVNLWLTPAWYRDALAEILAAGDAYGGGFAATRERVQVEMVSANPTGPITVAAARNGAYGDSVARLLAFAGHEVEREYYYNDAGAQMDRFRASVEARRRGEEPPEDGYQGEYIAELAQRCRKTRCRRCWAGSRRRWSASGSTSTRGRSRASSSSGCPSSCRASTRTRRTAPSGRARRRTGTRTTGC